jgi:hypothetical protein
VKADLEAYGGAAAVAADRAGQTQKRRITEHLARVFHDVLSGPIDLNLIDEAGAAPEDRTVVLVNPVAVD